MSRTRMVFALTLVGAILVALSAQAQQQGARPGGPRGGGMGGGMGVGMLLRIEKVQEDLKLSDDQKEQVRGLGRESRENREEAEKKLAAILKPEQLKRLTEIRVQVGGVAVLVETAVAKDLGLSEEQVTKLKDLQQKARESMRDAMQGVAPEERGAKMAELRKEHAAKAMEILTPEQKAKLETMKGAKIDIDMSRFQGGQRRRPAAK